MSIILAILIFGLLIFIHELGHFLVARWCGVTIQEFAIGMGPKLLSKRSKKSGIVYSLRLLPIGGFVSMLGENGMEAVQGSSDRAEREKPAENGEKDTFFFNDDTAKERESLPASENADNASAEPAKEPVADPHAYCNQSVWKRILISVAGPLMNIILGFFLMLVMLVLQQQMGITSMGTTEIAKFYVSYTAQEEQLGFVNGDYIDTVDGKTVSSYAALFKYVSESSTGTFDVTVNRLNEAGDEILTVELKQVPLSAAFLEDSFTASLSESSGLCVGDVVTKVNSVSVHTMHELAYEVMNQGYRPLRLTVLRNGEKTVLENIIVPSYVEQGITFGDIDFVVWGENPNTLNVGTLLKHAWYRSVSTVKMVFDSLFGLASGRYGVEAISGPVGITKTISDMAQTGLINVLYLVVVITINLGVMNLLPIPALDGGHLLIYFIEVIRRKPLKQEVEGMINAIGLVLMLALAVFIAVKDVISLL